jgi:predicted dehydrogenase
MRKKYAIAGASSRALNMFIQPMVANPELGEIVALFSRHPESAMKIVERSGGVAFPVYSNFEAMIKETNPDVVIVTTIDSLHDKYIIKAMELGCDVITEKPLTINAEKTNAIIEAKNRTRKNLVITFNFRFIPYNQKIKELITMGEIGEPLFVNLEYFNDYTHGSSYFRRWHGQLDQSGSLLITKGTHYYDLVSWWLEQRPVSVSAMGSMQVFGPNRAKRGERCLTCKYKDSCEFYWDITKDEFSSDLYHKTEVDTGYIRDKCVFHESIDVWDTMSLNVRYNKGAQMAMTLCVYSPYEGWKISITGTKGRLEAEEFRTGTHSKDPNQYIRVYHNDKTMDEYSIRKGEIKLTNDSGIANYTLLGHNGGDVVLRRMLFIGDTPDTLNQMAGIQDAVDSVLVGAGAVQSIQEGKKINIKDLLQHEIND